MDSSHWSGIAMVIAALLLPFVTKYSAGGVYAKAEEAEAKAELKVAQAEATRERASGRRWYQLFEQSHAGWRHERAARLMDRTVIAAIPGSPLIAWPALDPVPGREALIEASERQMPAAE